MISSSFIKGIQNEMRKDDGVDGDAQRLSQLVWLIFLKVLDDDERQKEFLDSGYKPAVPYKYRWRTWAGSDDGITGDALLEFVNNDLFPSLKNLEVDPNNRRTSVIKEVFANSFNYMKNGTQLRKVINKINEVDFNSSEDRHSFGDIYETLLSSLQSAGNAGEFYTPRPITKFIVEMVNPKLGERVFDPAAGTGGFLTGAIDHIRREVKTPEDEQQLQKSILGVEKKQLPYTLLITNMIFHGLEEPAGIRHDNTLARPLISYGPDDFVDVITANPPFGGSEEDGIEDNFPASFRTRETADLFLVLFVRLLKNGGRAGIVLPDGTLFGEGIKTRIKKYLLEECNLHTIVRLPGSVFAPYTSIATNLLFFTKGEPTKEVWYYEHRLPENVKAYNKTKPIRIEEFGPIKEWWHNRVESDVSWKVGIEEIIQRGYNLDIKNPNVKVADELNPEEILASHRTKWEKIDRIADELQAELRNTLNDNSSPNVRFLIENLHEYLRVPHAASLLKKNILHLAVSGELVPQVAGEGTADELYRQIQAEKNKRGLKRQKELPGISEEEKPFRLPQNWKWVRFGSIGNVISGTSYSKGDLTGNGVRILRGGNVNDGSFIELKDDDVIIDSTLEDAAKKVRVGDVVIVASTGSMSAIGKPSLVDKEIDAQIGAFLRILRAENGVNPKYFWFYICSDLYRNRIRDLVQGTNINNIKNEYITHGTFPLPPLKEQERIAQKADKVLELVLKLKKYLDS